MGDPQTVVSGARIVLQPHATLIIQDKRPGKSPGRPNPLRFCSIILLGRSFNDQALSFSPHSIIQPGGDEGTRTPGLRLAKAALSHLSYIPRGCHLRGGPDWIRTSDPCVISTVL